MSAEEISTIMETIYKMYIEIICLMKQYFPFEDDLLSNIVGINPYHLSHRKVQKFSLKFTRLSRGIGNLIILFV